MRTLWNISMMLLCIWLNVSISTEIGNQISLFGSHGCWFCHFTTREIFLRWFDKYFYDDSRNSDLLPCVFLSDQKSDISTNCVAAGIGNFMTAKIFQRWSDSLNLSSLKGKLGKIFLSAQSFYLTLSKRSYCRNPRIPTVAFGHLVLIWSILDPSTWFLTNFVAFRLTLPIETSLS